MRTVLILSLVSAVVLGAYAVPKPNSTLGVERIVGGVEADRHEFKFIVSIREGNYICTGAIISAEWVLTAHDCTSGSHYYDQLVAGDHNIYRAEDNEQVRQIVQRISYPDRGANMIHSNNIGLMKVSPPFEFNEYVQPVTLPDAKFKPTALATVAGWGRANHSPYPENLRKVEVHLVEPCQNWFKSIDNQSIICYGGDGKGACYGDYGAPLVCGEDQILCGILAMYWDCPDAITTDVYTDVSYFLDWIINSTIPTAEDPSTVEQITTCGGHIEASSGEIIFRPEKSIRANQKCVWTVKTPYNSIRFQLSSSGLGPNDGIYLTDFSNSEPGDQQRMTTIGQNYTFNSKIVLVTLSIGNAPSRGFRLKFFSSNFPHPTRDFTFYAHLNKNSVNYSYPIGGGLYGDDERALFVINPTVPATRTLTFTRMDLKNDWFGNCYNDFVDVYDWLDNQYTHVARLCRPPLPTSITFKSGLGLLTFTSNLLFEASGFDFELV